MARKFLRTGFACVAYCIMAVVPAVGQEQAAQPATKSVEAVVESTPAAGQSAEGQTKAVRASGQPGKPGPGGPGQPAAQPGQPGDQPSTQPGQTGTPAKPEPPKSTPRPTKPATPPNRDELKVRPDADGKIKFNFRGQPWLDVLEWLAAISQLSLDWQEVPNDFLNLRTQQSYTLPEARDLINRHLLDRGFTLLRHGEILSVVNIKKLDPSLVPRVRPAELEDRDPHEFVKVSFPLDWLTAESAIEELKPMLSPNGKLTPLKSTNRIEAIDAVVNLREIMFLLDEEQSNKGRKRLVRPFKLQFVRAADAATQLRGLLGMDNAPGAPLTPEQQQMQQQQQQMMMQRGGGGGQPQPPPPPKAESKIHLVVNNRENSILANAPADQMAIIAEAIKNIDIPADDSNTLLRNMDRMRVYRLVSVDPEPLVKVLEEMGNLDPGTRLQVDKKNRAIIAYASLADHLTIRNVVSRLDGTDRQFEVIKLRRLEADYVAGTIEFMMVGADKKKNQQNQFNPYFGYFGMGQRNEPEDDSKKFRVDADVEHNRLLLWSNEVELQEVRNLLVKLGEIPGGGANASTLRVLETVSPEEAEELLERIRRVWPGIGPNPLRIAPGADGEKPEARQAPLPKRGRPADELPKDTTSLPRAKRSQLASAHFEPALLSLDLPDAKTVRLPTDQVADDDAREAEPADAAKSIEPAESADPGETIAPALPDRRPRPRAEEKPAAPIRIGRGPDGRLVISSDDTLALDRLEDLVAQIAPPRRDYKIFYMKYKSTWAYGVVLNLKDFFEDKDKADERRVNRYWGMPNNSSDQTRKLSKRRPLKFISDSDSNSILVTGADPGQLKIIEDLIALYDVPASKDSAAARKTKVVPVKHSKARVIADAVKDVYRDLLSANDPALAAANQNNNQKQRPPEAMYTYVFNNGEEDKKPEAPLKFKGMLSIGVDELSNTLVVSAAEGLLANVCQTIEALDEAAKPTVNGLQVLKIDRNIDAKQLTEKLTKLVSKPPQPPQPPPGQPQQPAQQEYQQPHPNSRVIIQN